MYYVLKKLIFSFLVGAAAAGLVYIGYSFLIHFRELRQSEKTAAEAAELAHEESEPATDGAQAAGEEQE